MPPLDVQLTSHVRQRMRRRQVEDHQIFLTLEHPDEVSETSEPSMRFVRTFFDGRTLKVWVVVPIVGNVRIVKSAAWRNEGP